ncbi:MAG: tRNA pseudouridine(38-40) synthase TruA [Bacteroidota bacterium]|nr:tRNA pseudouridine(38-40) synthase TruA [Bacteroidota bacterium]
MRTRYALEISYKGSQFHGWQLQPNCNSVQAEMQKALSLICREPVHCLGCGRTDAGVHAKQFVLHFEINGELPERLVHKLNHLLTRDIAIHHLYNVDPNFSARFDCTERSYEYHIHQNPNPFLSEYSWYFFKNLDIELMNTAASKLLQHKDFKAFCKANSQVNHYECDLREALWIQDDYRLLFKITANRFLRNMVRAIVGSLVELGEGKSTLDEFEQIIVSQDRRESGQSAPPQGLFLARVVYPANTFEPTA